MLGLKRKAADFWMQTDTETDHRNAWIIPIASCLINAILFGVYRSYGIVLTVIIKTYSVSRSEATWFISLCMTVIHLTGPFSGLLNNHFTIRKITFFGCALATLGVGLCYFATNVTQIIVFIGIIQGFGIGMTYVQIPAIINENFVKFRATANGIAMSGGTIGAFVLCPITGYCLQNFTLDKCFLILSMVTLLSLPISFLLKTKKKKIDTQKKQISDALKRNSVYLISVEKAEEKVPHLSNLETTTDSPIRRESVYYKSLDTFSKKSSDFVLYMERKISVCNSNAIETIKKLSQPSVRSTLQTTCFRVINIVANPFFLLICITHLAYFWGSLTYLMVIVDHSQDRGIKRDLAAQLITTFSAGDLFGRIGSGCFLDNKLVPVKYVAMIAITAIGCILKLVPLFDNINISMALAASLGFISGVIVVLLNILFCKYIGTKEAHLAFGLSSFFCGLATIVRPMLVGYFRDAVNGSYDGLFNVLSIVAIITGCLWLLEPLLRRRQKQSNVPNQK
ncbi:Monocarboxylate transporter 12-like protein [Leptotrombidium deliense]|uniref:Monocarboxylate transporter 12-like protein n=1 Tax=Leptotrombidium deliense TaxID=299467 RepID=A0A443S9B5_9ACAR|nr:Monocarboxylate transporter 12-like protein [Leptotrombidium deliense]